MNQLIMRPQLLLVEDIAIPRQALVPLDDNISIGYYPWYDQGVQGQRDGEGFQRPFLQEAPP